MRFNEIYIFVFIFIFPISLISKNNFDTTSACYNCHQELKIKYKLEFIHPPVSEGECVSCHSEHGENNKLILKGPINELCFQCHQNDDDKFKKAHLGYFIPTTSCIKCHNPHASDNKKLIYSNQHIPFKNRKCPDCHDESADSTKIKGAITKLCRNCHDEQKTEIQNNKSKTKESEIHYHIPFLVGQCVSCHSPHTSKNTKYLKINSGQMCIEQCHVLLNNEKSSHVPVQKKECNSCHAPHKSPNKHLLKTKTTGKMSSISDLCLNCHKNIVAGKNVHMVVLAGECDSCHQNHTAPYKKLLKNEGKKLCYLSSCHESVEKDIYIHEPVRNGECVSCHNPHSTVNKNLLISKDNRAMLNIAQLCYRCHKQFEVKVGIHKPVAQGQCESCHDIHSSKNQSLLKEKIRKLCVSCHLDKTKTEKHNIADKICTECHDPHYPRQ